MTRGFLRCAICGRPARAGAVLGRRQPGCCRGRVRNVRRANPEPLLGDLHLANFFQISLTTRPIWMASAWNSDARRIFTGPAVTASCSTAMSLGIIPSSSVYTGLASMSPQISSAMLCALGGGRAAILVVPSVLAPAESNWLVNPGHPDFLKIRVHPPEAFRLAIAPDTRRALPPSWAGSRSCCCRPGNAACQA